MKWENFKEKFDNLFRYIPDSILNFLNLISAVIGIVVPFINGIILFIKKICFENIDISEITLGELLVDNGIVYIVFLVLILICFFVKIIKYRKVQQETRKAISDNYYKMLHDYRNFCGEIEILFKKNLDNVDNISVRVENLAQTAVDGLSDIFGALTRKKISACIKLIDPDPNGNVIEYSKSKVHTFVRSENSDSNRKGYDGQNGSVAICDNTDFKKIVSNEVEFGKSFFYQGDLIKYDQEEKKQGRKYENTNSKWENYYRSTIVVPIRIANKRVSHNEMEESYNIIGFLCLDSMSRAAFVPSQERYYVNLVKAYAALLYSIFEVYLRYLLGEKVGRIASESPRIASNGKVEVRNKKRWRRF